MNAEYLDALYDEAVGLLLQARQGLEEDLANAVDAATDRADLALALQISRLTLLLADSMAWLLCMRAQQKGEWPSNARLLSLNRDPEIVQRCTPLPGNAFALARLLEGAETLHRRLQELEDRVALEVRHKTSHREGSK